MSNEASTQAKANVDKTTEEKKPTKIEVEEVIKFDANIKSCFINTIELASVIDGLFAPAMRDYEGCKISLNDGRIPTIISNDIPYGALYVSLYFKDRSGSNEECPIRNVVVRSNTKGNTKMESLRRMTGAAAGRMYDITPETYEALDEFRFFPQRKCVWSNLTSEIVSNYGYSGTYNQQIVACITGLDLNKIINAIYGNRTDEGIFQYQVTPVQFVANVNGEYVLQITQLDVHKLESLRRSLGGPISTNEYHQCIR